MKICIIILLIAILLLQTVKMDDKEIPVHSDMPVVQEPDNNDKPVKFASNIVSTSTDETLCSASIISIHFLVSSCQRCLNNYGRPIPSQEIKILVPEFSETNLHGIGHNIYEVRSVRVHPLCIFWGEYDMKHDIGIVQTSEEIQFHANVRAAKLPHAVNVYFNASGDLMISTLQTRYTAVTNLTEAVWYVKVRTMPVEICSLVLNETYYDPGKVLCTPYYHAGSTHECETDFGASLSLENTLVGILIHKFSCGQPGSAASFVNVTLNSDWITKTVQKLSGGSESV